MLSRGSADDVRRETERRIRDLGPGGGLVCAPIHNVQADVPPANALAMFATARAVGVSGGRLA